MCHLSHVQETSRTSIYLSVCGEKNEEFPQASHMIWNGKTLHPSGMVYYDCVVMLAQNIHCCKKVCLINTFQEVLLNTDRFCHFFNAHWISYAQEERYITVPLKFKLTGSQSSILETRFSILENFEDRGSSRVSRCSRPFENLSSRVSRLSSGRNKGLFTQLTFATSEYFFTGTV